MVANEEEYKGRDKRENSNNTKVFDFELAQRLGIKMIEDNQVCIQGHRKCPEHVSHWKPIFLLLVLSCGQHSTNAQCQEHTFEEQSLGIDIAMKYLPLQVH